MKTMKKLTGILLFGLVLYFAGCQKEAIETTENTVENNSKTATIVQNLRVKNNMLYLTDVEEYEKTIDYLWNLGDENFEEWEENLSFNSMRKMMTEEEREKIGIEDDLFATLLNPDGMIHIGEYIFQVDVTNEIVLMVKDTEYEGSKLSGINVFNTKTNVRTFSIDDDIFSILEGNNPEKRSRFCKSYSVGPYYWYPPNMGGHRIKFKVVYQRGGLYRSLQAKIKKENTWGGSIDISLESVSGNWYEHKKSDGHVPIPYKYIGGNGHEYNYRPYGGWGVRRLTGYYFKVYFYADNNDPDNYWYKSAALRNQCHK